MRVEELFDWGRMEQHIKDGALSRQKHPTLPLYIVNYTHQCQFDGPWDDVTMHCRGLIYDDARHVIARPFRKFWNLNDSRWPETQEANLPSELPESTKKYDGSLGILWRYRGEWGIATRGSFRSNQSRWGTQWAKRLDLEACPLTYTPLFEIIYPENRIVVNYDFQGLVLLTMVGIEGSDEPSRSMVESKALLAGCRAVKRFDKTLAECVADNSKNEEGYVLRWPSTGLRIKVKLPEYVRLHKLITGISPKTIWEMLKTGEDCGDLLRDVPKEFENWVLFWEKAIVTDKDAVMNRALAIMLSYPGEKNVATKEQRKEFALYATQHKDLSAILFALLDSDHERAAEVAWKMARPRVTKDDVFKKDTDG